MNFTTVKLLTIEHMAICVVKSINIQIIGQVFDLSIMRKNEFFCTQVCSWILNNKLIFDSH